MKILIYLLCASCAAITSKWPNNPIQVKNNVINYTNHDIACKELGHWLANATGKNIIIKNSNHHVSVCWAKISAKHAWQQFRQQCLNQKPSSAKTTFVIKVRWLILDDLAETALGINNDERQITRKNLEPSCTLWGIIQRVQSFKDILNYLLRDLAKSKHIITIAEPTLVMSPNSESNFRTLIMLPYTVKTARSSYETIHSIPIDIKVKFNEVNQNYANISLTSHMQQTWGKTNNSWPMAVHEIKTDLNLRYSEETIIAKQIIYLKQDNYNKHKWLGALRDNNPKSLKVNKIYVIASVTKSQENPL